MDHAIYDYGQGAAECAKLATTAPTVELQFRMEIKSDGLAGSFLSSVLVASLSL